MNKRKGNQKISVCMATYNGEMYIREQIESILSQLSESDELVISDDGSTDGTVKIVNSFTDRRIKLIFNTHKHGFIGNFENALRHVNGYYIFLSDQDDIWKPNKVECVLNWLAKYDLVIHNAELINGTGQPIGKNYYDCMHTHDSFVANLIRPRYLGCCMAFNKKVLDIALPFVSQYRGHDYWIGCVASLYFKTVFIDDVLISYRRHGGNISPSSEKSSNGILKMFFKRLDMIRCLMLRYFHIS